MSSKPRVNYFNAKARAEPIRLVLSAAGVEFEDNRVEREKWPELKPQSPSGVMPWVDTPEGPLVQGPAAARYLARQHGMMGQTDREYYLVERALAQFEDIWSELVKVFFLPEDKKQEALEDFKKNKGHSLFNNLEKFLGEGGSDAGLFVKSGLTLADLWCLHIIDECEAFVGADFVAQFAKLSAITENVKKKSPRVAKWLETRPKTQL